MKSESGPAPRTMIDEAVLTATGALLEDEVSGVRRAAVEALGELAREAFAQDGARTVVIGGPLGQAASRLMAADGGEG